MQAKQGKLDPQKSRCDRCQTTAGPVHECCFSFKAPYADWKALWEARQGKRLTNHRKRHIAAREHEQLDLRALSQVAYWMDLCGPCWDEASRPWTGGFPEEFYRGVLVNNPGGPFLKKTVPTKTP